MHFQKKKSPNQKTHGTLRSERPKCLRVKIRTAEPSKSKAKPQRRLQRPCESTPKARDNSPHSPRFHAHARASQEAEPRIQVADDEDLKSGATAQARARNFPNRGHAPHRESVPAITRDGHRQGTLPPCLPHLLDVALREVVDLLPERRHAGQRPRAGLPQLDEQRVLPSASASCFRTCTPRQKKHINLVTDKPKPLGGFTGAIRER